MFFSLLVPTLGERVEEFRRLLGSLRKQSFKNFEIVVVTQINHEVIKNLIKEYDNLNIVQVEINKKGLSRARNYGLGICKGEWILLSDDDCWYPEDALSKIKDKTDYGEYDIILTRIYDPINKLLYKGYKDKSKRINKIELMSKSSIEIAIKRSAIQELFDERLGLGAEYICGEEVDFLLNSYRKNKVLYSPVVTVFHEKKSDSDFIKQIIAKGALYAKHYGRILCVCVLLRDLVLKKENNWRLFWKGYNEIKMGKVRDESQN